MISLRLRFIGTVLCALLAALGPTACVTVGPNFSPPPDRSPAKWHSKLPDGLTSVTMTPQSLATWWATFNDPVLTGLIEQAVANNLDLKSAVSRLRQARAQRAVTQGGLFPTLSFSGSAIRSHTTTRDKMVGKQETESTLYSTAFDSLWEADVFGGLRRSLEAADRDLQARQAALYDVLVSLTAEVALNYATARTYQSRLDLAEANLRIQKETFDLAESRFRAQLIGELPVQQARYAYESTASQIPGLRTGLEEALNHLAILLGENPGAVHERLAERRPIPSVSFPVAVGVPSEILRRRPDIRRAEQELAAQTARIGVAVADLYPKFYISGFLSRQGVGSVGFTDYATDAWSWGPRVSWDIFKAGALRQNVRVQTELKEQSLIAYQSAILTALEEVENKIVAYGQEQIRRETLASAATAAQSALRLAQDQFKVGRIAFTDVLNAEQSLVVFQDQLAQSEGAKASDLISLFKALGGGWTPIDAASRSERNDVQRKDSSK